MCSVHNFQDNNTLKESIIAIGNYDGLHLGHQSIIGSMIACSRKTKIPTVLITFNPHTNDIIYDN